MSRHDESLHESLTLFRSLVTRTDQGWPNVNGSEGRLQSTNSFPYF